MKRTFLLFVSLGIIIRPTQADQPSLEQETKQDVVLRAMVDELQRSQQGVVLPDMAKTYFIEYGLQDVANANFTAELGAISNQDENRYRTLQTTVRVGAYELDNTNFSEGGWGGGGRIPVPVEDDYDAIRQSFWWSTDRQYKDAVEDLARKKAFMESKMIQDKPDDFSHEKPSTYLEPRGNLTIDVKKIEALALALSAVFKNYPDIQSSEAHVSTQLWNRYLVNTEGTRIRSFKGQVSVEVQARAQADDGMRFNDSFSIFAADIASLPPVEELTRRCQTMAENLLAVRQAPRMNESYSGPVLCDASVAASFLKNEFGWRFCGGQRPVGGDMSAEDFSQKLNKRIFPRSVNITDDPTQTAINGKWVLGQYKYDAQGVPAQAVHLVEAGRLKALDMSRNPSKEFKISTGHGRGFSGANAMIGCVSFTSTEALDAEAMKKELLEAAQDEDLGFGLRLSAMDASSEEFPLRLFKVMPDGHEELIRGLHFGQIDLKAYKRILAFGKDLAVANDGGSTVAAPAILFEELDLSKIDQDFDKPPILPHPLARAGPPSTR